MWSGHWLALFTCIQLVATHLQNPSFFLVSLYCNHLCRRVEVDICSTELQDDDDDDKCIYKLLNKIRIY